MPDTKHVPGYVPNPDYTQEDWDDVHSPELTEEDFAQARPLREAMPELFAALERAQAEGPKTDPDNPLALFVKRVRASRGMTQREFAETYGMAVARLRDWEQGRFKPDAMTVAYLAVIEHEPEAVARATNKHRAAA